MTDTTNNLYLFQPQHRTDFGTKSQYWFPYSVGVIWAYARQFDSIQRHWNCDQIFFKRSPVSEVLETMRDPVVCGFSVYVWNHRYTLAVAQAIKEKWPNCILVFGGPEVASSWLKHDFADVLVFGEGERSWVKILDDIAHGRQPERIVKTARMDSLDCVPSPYASGVFDQIVVNNPDVYWSAPFETNRGCPYACTFCDWGGLTQSKIKNFSLDRIKADIDWLSSHRVKTIFITDANFGIFKQRDLEIARLIRQWINERPGLEYISMNYAKMSNEVVFEIAKEFGSINKGITFSVQSMNPDVLKAIKRQNMKSHDIQNLIGLSTRSGLHHYTELILGLPAETKESWKQGVCDLLELGQHSRIEILLAMIMENTEMFTHQIDQYNLETVEVVDFIPLAVDESGIKEASHIVRKTSTMTTEDLIESYMYSWMITHFHINNYSQILAKYCRHVKTISYRQFYDKLFLRLWTGGNTKADLEFKKIKQALTNIYMYGDSQTPDISLSNLQFGSIPFVYSNMYDFLDISLDMAKKFGDIDPGIIDIHYRTLYNDRYQLPYLAHTNVDIETWKPGTYTYEILGKNNLTDKKNYIYFFKNVRRGKEQETIIRQVTT